MKTLLAIVLLCALAGCASDTGYTAKDAKQAAKALAAQKAAELPVFAKDVKLR